MSSVHPEIDGDVSTNGNSNEVAIHPVLRRHYSSIGIGEVFVQASNIENVKWLVPSAYFASSWKLPDFSNHLSSGAPAAILGDELIGNLKCAPEDFVVREIAVVQGQRQLADLELTKVFPTGSVIDESIHSQKKKFRQDAITASKPSHPELVVDNYTHTRGSPKLSNLNQASFIDDFQLILKNQFHSIDSHPSGSAIDAFQALQRLESDALNVINFIEKSSKLSKAVTLPSLLELRLSFFVSSEHQKQEKTRIHQCFRGAFPLLVAESLPREVEMVACLQTIDQRNIYLIMVKIDVTFYDLIPYLYAPVEDLPCLYIYAKYGFEYARDQFMKNRKEAPKVNCTFNVSSRGFSRYNFGCPVLRLKPNIPRCERRPLHQLIDAKSKSMLGTETINNFPLFSVETSVTSGSTSHVNIKDSRTTAIRVSWTKMAARRSLKKRVHEECVSDPNVVKKESSLILCVLRKRQREHLGMINTISSVLKCPPSLIGLAGIKDLQSVAYQFCTLNRFASQRIRSTRDVLLQRGIEIAPLCEIDHSLNTGDLVGNHFEIVLRNIRRVQLEFDPSTNACQALASFLRETFVPVDKNHLLQMVNRIKTHGFINFYGEQRVGDPGHIAHVGVRAFDIGKAMLQQNFSEAIDLLMSGRRLIHGCEIEGDNIELFRRTWKVTNGDPIATMKALPAGGNSAPRERAILKGLIRYGKDKPLTAFRCLQRNERLFFVNAYQSYVWNRMATERMRRYGSVVVIGDLLLCEGSVGDKPSIATVSDVGSASIARVVLPMPGYGVQYPTNDIGQLYKEFLQQENVHFDKNALHDECKAHGSYRRLISYAENLNFEFIPSTEKRPAVDVKFTFSLNKGSYATMLLRELMLRTVARDSAEYTS